ncbi:MAG TPA: metallophosphoesterase family protein [Kofleriaceae bacterium]|nr:metallophosphoesterase family protein [Kofleriaceae bacterium]
MKTLVQISDPHFGTEDRRVLAGLLRDLEGVTAPRPDVLAISGDLTQRARVSQFQAARAFLDRLDLPFVVVPGNHDVPLYNMFNRLFRPLDRYKQYITDDLAPTYFDNELAVIGIDTAHGFTIKDGRVTDAHTTQICAQLGSHHTRWRVLVAHHPFVMPLGAKERDLVNGAHDAVKKLEACGIDVILTGHMHVPYTTDAAGYAAGEGEVIAVHAGTCLSTRLRGEPNGYNRLEFAGEQLTIVHRIWDGEQFVDGPSNVYQRRKRAGAPGATRFEQVERHEGAHVPVPA